ncbi:hypothetical protein BDP81DRAFT_411290 [Colletotrichum phormii]|uniref:Uncharacterized protein n=1 Tax=Colletotrichum phormii TaxID=359342 RepID=A0AAI9ZDJ8_9PEZI|nr:uncharacterized protein BDP81DRAFT_411290 [Colletotrichum phormii]KAK1622466.1 hypothetical protein BDP81DRAFT_411290 [Colletotrichum phormii]
MPLKEEEASSEARATALTQSKTERCIIFAGDLSGPILATGGVNVGNDVKIESCIRIERSQELDLHIFLWLQFPDGADNEDQGRGMTTTRSALLAWACPTATYWSPTENGSLHGVTLADFIRRKTFHVLLVKGHPVHMQKRFGFGSLPPPFDYPYGDLHDFDLERSAAFLAKAPRKEPFHEAMSFKNDNARLTATTQSLIQDVLYVWQQAQLIAAVKLHAYFVPIPGCNNKYYTILSLPQEFMNEYAPAWNCLMNFQVSLSVWDDPDKELSMRRWQSKFISYTSGIEALVPHQTAGSGVVLVTARPPESGTTRDVSTFSSRVEAEEAGLAQ